MLLVSGARPGPEPPSKPCSAFRGTALRRLDQAGHISAHEAASLGVGDDPHKGGTCAAECPGRPVCRHLAQSFADIVCRQVAQDDIAYQLRQGLRISRLGLERLALGLPSAPLASRRRPWRSCHSEMTGPLLYLLAQLVQLLIQIGLRPGRDLPAPALALAVLAEIQLASPAAVTSAVIGVLAVGALVVEVERPRL